MFTELSGVPVKKEIEDFITAQAALYRDNGECLKLAVIRAGDDPGQHYYEQAIIKASDKYGIETAIFDFDPEVSQSELEAVVSQVNSDDSIHGVIMLRPFPSHIDGEILRHLLDPDKDIDAITDTSISETFVGKKDAFNACTAQACMEVLHHYGIDVSGRNVTIFGRSLVVGKPLSVLMMNENATVTVCHSRTPHEEQLKASRNADIVVLATGRTEHYGSEYFRDGQIVLDVGTGTGKDGKMHGDLNISEIKAEGTITDMTYTPVPRGIGTVTTALLLRNVVRAAERKKMI